MIDKYNEIVSEYKKYIEKNSKYYTINPKQPLVVKGYTSTSPYFPIITIQASNIIDTNYCTVDKIENYKGLYITINIYTKNKTLNNQVVASELINDELTNLTLKFFESINLKMTLCRPTPDMDASIFRRTIQYQCLVGTARGNIIRR